MRLQDCRNNYAYVIVGDGELNEGQCWEGIIQAGRMKLKHLTVLVDANGLAGIGEICADTDWENAFQAFGFQAVSVDGHDVDALKKSLQTEHDKPLAVICRTTKGKGISFMENENDWHYRPISQKDYERIKSELGS